MVQSNVEEEWSDENPFTGSSRVGLGSRSASSICARLIPLVPARLGMVRSAMRSLDGNPRTFLLCSHGEPVEA